MQHLHIPLSRNIQTTRRFRWVVWLLASTIMFFVSIIWWASGLIFTRDAIYNAAPEGTTSALRLFTSQKKANALAQNLEDVSLISNKSITFSDLVPYARGEMVIFFDQNGGRSVAIRKSKEIPRERIDAESIVETPVSRHIVLLSEKPIKLKPFRPSRKIFPKLSWPNHVWTGEWVDGINQKRGYLFARKDGFDVTIPAIANDAEKIRTLPMNTIAYLSTPVWTKEAQDLFSPFLSLTESIADTSFVSQMKNASQSKNLFILTKSQEDLGFLIKESTKNTITPEKMENILKTVAALNTPRVIKTPLADGSTIQELVATPSSISADEITRSGTQIQRVELPNHVIIGGILDTNHLFITNKESFFDYIKQKQGGADIICGGDIAGIAIKPFFALATQRSRTPNSSPILALAQHFSGIGIKTGVFTKILRFCK